MADKNKTTSKTTKFLLNYQLLSRTNYLCSRHTRKTDDKTRHYTVVDDNKGILTAVQMLLGTYFEKVITISTPNKIKATLHDENIDVVLLDMNFSAGINTGNEGLFWLSEIKKEDASIQVVLFTAYADIDLAVRGIKEGDRKSVV